MKGSIVVFSLMSTVYEYVTSLLFSSVFNNLILLDIVFMIM